METRLRDIDLLRGYAVAVVVVFHMALTFPQKPHFTLEMLGHTDMETGVDLFFVVSGFVISLSLSRLWSAATAREALLLKNIPLIFYQKRFVRLWPAAAFWLALNVVLSLVYHGEPLWPPPGLVLIKALSGFAYLYNFQEYGANGPLGYFWSLSVEWQFYLVLPPLLLLVRDDRWRLGVLGAGYLATLLLQPGGPLWWLFRFDGIVFGILLYVLMIRLELHIPRYRSLESPFWRPVATFMLLLLIITVPDFMPDRRTGLATAAALCTVLVALAATDRGYISTFGIRPVIAWIGSRSYSIYLCHMPIAMTVIAQYDILLRRFGRPGAHENLAVDYAASLVLIAAAAEATYRLLERPSHLRSQRLAYPPRLQGVKPNVTTGGP